MLTNLKFLSARNGTGKKFSQSNVRLNSVVNVMRYCYVVVIKFSFKINKKLLKHVSVTISLAQSTALVL